MKGHLFNGILDPNEDDGDDSLPEDNRNGVLDGLLEYVTVYSKEPNTSPMARKNQHHAWWK